LLAALYGARAPLSFSLNLGPGDAPYLEGFLPDYEIDDRVATHWTTYDATVAVPLEVKGSVALSYRYARVFPQTARVEVYLGDTLVDRFECRGGRFEERTVRVTLASYAPLRVRFKVDSHEGRNQGLKLDWLRVDVEEGSARLSGWAPFASALVLLVLWAVIVSTGWAGRNVAFLIAPWSIAAAVGVFVNPWTVHQVLRGVPLALVLFGGAVVGLGRWLRGRQKASPEAVRALTALLLSTFLLRALAVNHPRFYYPDLRTHARLVETMKDAGLDFFVSPSTYIAAHGVWRTDAYGRTYAFPYTPGFHLPFAVLPLEYDSLLVAMKLYAAALSTIPIVFVWALARRWRSSLLAALLMVAVPTYTSRLSFAFLPALFGHAVDLAFLYWLSGRLDSLSSPRVFLRGALFVAGCQLAYVSGTLNLSVFLLLLAVAEGLRHRAVRPALTVVSIAAAGSLVSVASYYRDFIPMVTDVLTRAVRGGSASRYAVESWLAVAYERTRSFFDGLYPLLALGGLYSLHRRKEADVLPAVWFATYLLLLLGRAKMPDIFRHGHETMFVTPLVALASGEALLRLSGLARAGRAAAYAVVLLLFVQGFFFQWRFIAEQLGNAL